MSYYDTTGRPLRRIVVFMLAVTGSAYLAAAALAHTPTSHHGSMTTAAHTARSIGSGLSTNIGGGNVPIAQAFGADYGRLTS